MVIHHAFAAAAGLIYALPLPNVCLKFHISHLVLVQNVADDHELPILGAKVNHGHTADLYIP